MAPCSIAVLSVLVVRLLAAPAAVAQATQEARVTVTVLDETRAVIRGATVSIVGVDDVTKKLTIAPVKTSDKGIATFARLPVGRYSIQAEFPGFQLGLLRDVRLRGGDNKHVLVLPLGKFAAEITVGRDRQAAASDRGTAFGTALTREQVEALSDDPEEMARQLADIAGPGAVTRVDSFEGQQLPPKAQIKAIHITRDTFAAENHLAGGLFIDIITQPGIGALRGSAAFMFYDSALDGSNPLIPKKGPAQNRQLALSLGGSLIKDKSSFSLSVSHMSSYRTPNLYAAVPSGTIAQNVNLRQPSNGTSVSGSFDYAITRDQTLRVSFGGSTSTSKNQGVGAYDLLGRGYSSASRSYSVRVQEAGPVGRRFFINTRFSLNWNDADAHSNIEAQTIVVNDAFTSGGAQRAGGRHTRSFSLASDLDYVRGIHSWRTGVQIDGGRYRSDDWTNYLGTFTFDSLTSYEAGQPRTYTRRIGDPDIAYWNIQAGWYLQDDIRLRKSLTLSPGVRVEAQTHLKDYQNIGPRIGITWAPFKSGRTTLRASFGVFYDWLSAGIYEQTLRVDGVHQQELIIQNPSYPDPGTAGDTPATNRYLLGGDLSMARNTRLSAGIEQQITRTLRVSAVYGNVRASGVLVGHNLNAPVGGIRPDPTSANVIETVSAGASRSQSVSASISLNLSGQAAVASGPRFAWRRGLMVSAQYGLSKARNNTEGAFSVPASNTLATEWGPASGDVRHRVSVSLYSQALKNFSMSLYAYMATGSPYTIRTGRDDNGDLIYNDRPAGVGRNTVRTASSWNTSASFGYTIGLGKRTVPTGPGIMIVSSGGSVSATTMASSDAARYRLRIYAYIQNLTNHANYVGYSGLMTSPFFLKPTSVSGVRTVNLQVGFSF